MSACSVFASAFAHDTGLTLLCSALLLTLAVVMVTMSVWRLRFTSHRPTSGATSGATLVRYAIAFCSASVVVTALVLAWSFLQALLN
ncbi:MAG: hypothetical protein ACMZI0_09545 [Symbiopectobacterium sp.]|uniref:hypothetical protein n=1 Tax=Symbiopectobacterium sp. TaxID=2952789 RepID=UPI0039E76D12